MNGIAQGALILGVVGVIAGLAQWDGTIVGVFLIPLLAGVADLLYVRWDRRRGQNR